MTKGSKKDRIIQTAKKIRDKNISKTHDKRLEWLAEKTEQAKQNSSSEKSQKRKLKIITNMIDEWYNREISKIEDLYKERVANVEKKAKHDEEKHHESQHDYSHSTIDPLNEHDEKKHHESQHEDIHHTMDPQNKHDEEKHHESQHDDSHIVSSSLNKHNEEKNHKKVQHKDSHVTIDPRNEHDKEKRHESQHEDIHHTMDPQNKHDEEKNHKKSQHKDSHVTIDPRNEHHNKHDAKEPEKNKSSTLTKTPPVNKILEKASRIEGIEVAKDISVEKLPMLKDMQKSPKTLKDMAHFAHSEAKLLIQHHVIQAIEKEKKAGLAAWLVKLATAGPRIIAIAEDKLVQPLLTPIVESMLLGKEELGFHANEALDEGMITLANDKFNWQNQCIFVSTGPSCTDKFKQTTHEFMTSLDGQDTLPSQFMKFVSIHPHGMHTNSGSTLQLYTHLCYDVNQVWNYLAEKGFKFPPGGLYEALYSEKNVILAFPHSIPNPAHESQNVCQHPVGFDSVNEPKFLPTQDIETLLRSVFALIYVETLELFHKRTTPYECRYNKKSKEAELRHKIQTSESIDARLNYMFGTNACSHPISKIDISKFYKEIYSARKRLVPQAARMHIRNGIVGNPSLRSGAARAREAFQYAFDMPRARRAVRYAVHGVRSMHKILHKTSALITFIRPMICFCYFLFLIFKGDPTMAITLEQGHGAYAAAVEILLSTQAARGLISVYSLWQNFWQASKINRVMVAARSIVLLITNFLGAFLPHANNVWQMVVELAKAQTFANIFGLESKFTKDTLVFLSSYIALEWPFEVLQRLGTSLNDALAFSVYSNSKSFTVNLAIACILALRGQTLELTLRFMEFMCHIAGYSDCNAKTNRYRSLLRIVLPFLFGYNLIVGQLLVFLQTEASDYVQILWSHEVTKLFWKKCGMTAIDPIKLHSEIQEDLESTANIYSSKTHVASIKESEDIIHKEAEKHKKWILNESKDEANLEKLRENLPKLKIAIEKATAEHGTLHSFGNRVGEEFQESGKNIIDYIVTMQDYSAKHYGHIVGEAAARAFAAFVGTQGAVLKEGGRRITQLEPWMWMAAMKR